MGASFICCHIDFDDYSDPSQGFVHNVNDVYWPFRDVWWACSESSIKRQFDATKKFTSSDRDDYAGEFLLPLWGNSAKGSTMHTGALSFSSGSGLVTPKPRRIPHALSPTIYKQLCDLGLPRRISGIFTVHASL